MSLEIRCIHGIGQASKAGFAAPVAQWLTWLRVLSKRAALWGCPHRQLSPPFTKGGGIFLSGWAVGFALADDRQNGSDDLSARIARAKAAAERESAGPSPKGGPGKGYGQGSRVLMELIGAPLGGGVLGWALDRWFGTSPWLLLIFIALAVLAAFRNIYRISKEQAE